MDKLLTKSKYDKFNRKTQNKDCHIVWEDHQKPHCTTEYEKVRHENSYTHEMNLHFFFEESGRFWMFVLNGLKLFLLDLP